MKAIRRWILLLLAVILAVGLYFYPWSQKKPVNVLLVSIDSLRADHLGCYGYERDTSPNIDALSRQGTVFLNAISTSSWTLPAHMSLLTSLDISVHGVATDGFSLHPNIQTLTQILRKNGYSTACFCTSPYMNPAFGFDRGFDVYYNTDFEQLGFDDTIFPPAEQRDEVHQDITSPRITELTVDWLKEGSSRPFFLFLHMWDVHYDYIPPPPYDRLFDSDYGGEISGEGYIHNENINPEMDPRDLHHIIALYDGEIAYTDYHLGLIFKKLKEMGIFEQTLIIITADHGDEFFEHGNKGHRITLYDEVIKVPLIIKLPSPRPVNQKVANQVSLIDLPPTILDVLKIKIPEQMQGSSLLPLMRGKKPAFPCSALSELSPVLYALRTKEWKLLYNTLENVSIILDLENDPEESHACLITGGPIWFKAHQEFYNRLARDGRLAGKYRGGEVGRRMIMDEEQIKRLRSLGYIK